MEAQAWTILGLPLLAFVLIVFVTWRQKDLSSLVAIGAIFAAAVLAYGVFLSVLGGASARSEFEWARLVPRGAAEAGQGAGEGFLSLGIQVDPLTALMLVVVTTVSFF